MSYEKRTIIKTLRLNSGDPEWDEDASGFVCIAVEPIGYSAETCAQAVARLITLTLHTHELQ